MTENELRLKRTGKKERRKRRKRELEAKLRKAPPDVQEEYADTIDELYELRMEVGRMGLSNLLGRSEVVAANRKRKRDGST